MKVVIKGARIAFANLWEPRAVGADGTPRCGASFLLDPKTQADEIKKIVDAMRTVASEKWGAKAEDMLRMLKGKDDLCLHNGDTKSEYDGFPGMMFISAHNQARPVVLDKNKSPLTQADGKPYSGCYVNASIDIWAQDNKWGKRVNAKLLAVQFERDGEAFTGGSSYDDSDFEGDGAASPTAGDDFFS